MKRKTIKPLQEIPDHILFQSGMSPKEVLDMLDKNARTLGDTEYRCSRLFLEFASLTKRFINEGVRIEEYLSHPGMENLSKAIYAMEWSELYYKLENERQRLVNRGYWKCLWDAFLGRI